MITRCYNPRSECYPDYGGRGILVCNEWLETPNAFITWATEKWQKGLQIDRIENDQGYSPDNCHFVTRRNNCNNRRSNTPVTVFGETLNFRQACEKYGVVKENTVWQRWRRLDWPLEEALTRPLIPQRDRCQRNSSP